MANKKKEADDFGIPEEVEKKARGIIESAFQFFNDYFGKLSDDFARIDKEHKEIKDRIKRGPRRANGRIV